MKSGGWTARDWTGPDTTRTWFVRHGVLDTPALRPLVGFRLVLSLPPFARGDQRLPAVPARWLISLGLEGDWRRYFEKLTPTSLCARAPEESSLRTDRGLERAKSGSAWHGAARHSAVRSKHYYVVALRGPQGAESGAESKRGRVRVQLLAAWRRGCCSGCRCARWLAETAGSYVVDCSSVRWMECPGVL